MKKTITFMLVMLICIATKCLAQPGHGRLAFDTLTRYCSGSPLHAQLYDLDTSLVTRITFGSSWTSYKVYIPGPPPESEDYGEDQDPNNAKRLDYDFFAKDSGYIVAHAMIYPKAGGSYALPFTLDSIKQCAPRLKYTDSFRCVSRVDTILQQDFNYLKVDTIWFVNNFQKSAVPGPSGFKSDTVRWISGYPLPIRDTFNATDSGILTVTSYIKPQQGVIFSTALQAQYGYCDSAGNPQLHQLAVGNVSKNISGVYPNPVINSAKIVAPFETGQMKVYDLLGRCISTIQIINHCAILDAHDFVPGLYSYQLIGEGKKTNGRFVKQ